MKPISRTGRVCLLIGTATTVASLCGCSGHRHTGGDDFWLAATLPTMHYMQHDEEWIRAALSGRQGDRLISVEAGYWCFSGPNRVRERRLEGDRLVCDVYQPADQDDAGDRLFTTTRLYSISDDAAKEMFRSLYSQAALGEQDWLNERESTGPGVSYLIALGRKRGLTAVKEGVSYEHRLISRVAH